MPLLPDIPSHPEPPAQRPRSPRPAGRLEVMPLGGLVLIALTAAALSHGCAESQPQEPRVQPPPGPASASSSTTSTATQDAQSVLQAVVDLDALAPFLHPEAPGRVPLTLAIPSAPPGIALTRFGQPVRVVASAPGGDAPCLEITALELQGDRATVSFSYPIEGVVGSAELSRNQGRWAVVRRSVAER